MAIGANERQRSAVPLQDPDGRLIVVGPNGVPLSGGGGGAGADPLSDGDPAGALPSKTLWVAGADGNTLRGLVVDAAGRLKVAVESLPAVSVSNFPTTQPVSGVVSVSNFPATQPVSGPLTDVQLRAGPVPVAGPVTDAQLRASAIPVSGTLTDAQLRASAVPVSGNGTFDTSDRTTREVGRVRLWDGVDEATIIPRGSVPSPTDKGVAVVSLNVARPSYQVVTPEITSGTAVAVARPLQIWHPNTSLKDVFILEIGANVGVMHTAGRYSFEIEFITAESATGTLITTNVQQTNRGDAATGCAVRHSVTGETAATAGVFQRAVQAPFTTTTSGVQAPATNYDGVVIYRAKDLDDYSDAIMLRNGVNEGLLVRQNILSILTGAPIYSIYARWVERA